VAGLDPVIDQDPEAGGVAGAGVAARNFDEFLRGLGTQAVLQSGHADKRSFAHAIARLVGSNSNEFWWSLAA